MDSDVSFAKTAVQDACEAHDSGESSPVSTSSEPCETPRHAALEACQPFHEEKTPNAILNIRDNLVAHCAEATPSETIDIVIRCRDDATLQALKRTYPTLAKAKGVHRLAGAVRCKELLPLLQAPPEGVLSFHRKTVVRLYNNAATSARFLGTDATHGLGAYGLNGRGEIVSVLDTGISTGDARNNFHFDLKPALYGMVAEPSASSDIPVDVNGHGTHVCGSVVSQGEEGNEKTRAGATGAALFAQGFYDANLRGPNLMWDPGLHYERARLVGAKILSNSWGTVPFAFGTVTYDEPAMAVDAFVWNNPEALVCFAVGNEGNDKDSDGRADASTALSSEIYAKNALVVGAQESYRTDDPYTNNDLFELTLKHKGLANDYITRPFDGKHDGMALFSSRGPLSDGRIAPMLVAPGTGIVSTGIKNCVAKATMSGTSMATPHVAASAAIFRQYLREYQQLPNPTAALMRAGLILCAESLYPGQYGTENPEVPETSPNSVEGWGALRLGKHLAGIQKDGSKTTPQTLGFHDAITLNTAHETKTFTFTTNAIGEVRAVLSWIDYHDIYKDPVTKVFEPLYNDYDLTVQAPNGERYTLNDHRNPIERICIPNAPIGTYTLTVSASRIAKTGSGNLAAIAWCAPTAQPPPTLTRIASQPTSEKTTTLTVKLPAGVTAYKDYPIWPAPGEHILPRGEKIEPFAGPRLAVAYNEWKNESAHVLSHLAGWILFDAQGRPVRQHFPTFESVLAKPYDYEWTGGVLRPMQTLKGLAQRPEAPVVLEDEAYTLQWYETFPGYGLRLK